MFSSWQMGLKSKDNDQSGPIKLRKNYLNIKTKMKISWRKWTNVGISVALLINVILICWVVLLFYFVTVTGSVHEMVLQLMPSATLYYVFSGLCYFACKHLIPQFLFLLRNLGYQNEEAKLNFYVARVFFIIFSFYLILLLALHAEFPNYWSTIFKTHLYLHTIIDILVLLGNIVFVILPLKVTNLLVFLSRFHPFDEFTMHEKLPTYAVDLLILNLSMFISQTLVYVLLAKFFLNYLVTFILARFSRNCLHQNFFSAKNVNFLEKTFMSLSLSIGLIVQICLLLPPNIRECSFLSQILKGLSLTETAEPQPQQQDPNTNKATHPLQQNQNYYLTYTNVFVATIFIMTLMFLLKSSINEFCLRMEGLYLRRHLEDINQDKYYQVKKQKQWYPNCKCHEMRTRRHTSNKNNTANNKSSNSNSRNKKTQN